MIQNLLTLSSGSPSVGDSGISPVFFVVLIICLAIVIGGIVWMALMNGKTDKTTIVITDEDDLSPENSNVIEDIVQGDTDNEEN